MGKAKRPCKLDGIAFDALLKQDDSWEAEIPDYPVESGKSVNDSVIIKPFYISAELYLTNTPITWSRRQGGRSRVRQIEEQLKAAFLSKKPMVYSTTDRTYSNMCLESLTISKSEEEGYSRKITVNLKQVTVTQTKTGIIPDSYVRGGSTAASAGTSSTKPATNTGKTNGGSSKAAEKETSEKKGSILYNAANSSGLLGGKK
ncbi:MAG: phage baseplate protein [Lachnospiraceae bacterium]